MQFGWIKDPPKAKDYDAAKHDKLRVGAPLPEAKSLAHLIPTILNQGNLGSCTANACAQAIRASHIREGWRFAPSMSRLFAYYFARATHQNTQEDTGTWIRAIFDAIRKLGFCPETAWPYADSGELFKTMPSADATRLAFDQRADLGYFRISETGDARLDAIKRAIANEHCVVFGTPVAQSFCDFQPGQILMPPKTEKQLGGHALTIAGYDANGNFDIVNSWGDAYGDLGWCKFSPEYIAWSESNDFWIVDTVPAFTA